MPSGFFDGDLGDEEEDDDLDALDQDSDQQVADQDDDKIEVEIVADPNASKWRGDPSEKLKEDDNDKDFGKRVQKRIKTLTAAGKEVERQRDADRKQLAEVAAFAQAQVARVAELERQAEERKSQSFSAQAKGAETEASLAQNEYKQALISGDALAAADANSRVTDAKVRAQALKRDSEAAAEAATAAKTKAEDAVKKAQDAHKVSQQVVQQQQAPVVPSKRIAWFKANPWFDANGQDAKSAYAIAINKELLEDGVEGDSEEYFSAINKAMKERYPKSFGGADKEERRSGTVRSERTARGSDGEPLQPKVFQGNKLIFNKSQYAMIDRLGLRITGWEVPKSQAAIKTRRNLIAFATECDKVNKKESR